MLLKDFVARRAISNVLRANYMFVSTYRTIKFAVQGFWRNIWLSVVTVIILVLTLLSISIVWGTNVVASQAIASIKDKVDVSVYFKPEVKADQVLAIQYRLEDMSQVKSVQYVSPEDALAKFKEAHKNDPVILESLNELKDNPLGATLIIKANNIDDYPEILKVLDDPNYSNLIYEEDKSFEDSKSVITRLSDISHKVGKIGLVISGVFIIITILIVFNTVRINIYTHREEIGIMKLVGATNWFIRSPFLLESVLYGIISAGIAIAIFYPLLGVISPQVSNFFEGYNFNLINYFNSHFWLFLGFLILCAVLLSVVSSAVAIGKYLKV